MTNATGATGSPGMPSAAALRENPSASAQSPTLCAAAGRSVDVVTGRVSTTEVDVSLPGVLPLWVRRTYMSSYTCGRAFGQSWASTLDTRLEVDERGVLFVREDGTTLVYPPPSAWGPVLPEAGPRWPLMATADGYSVIDSAAGLTWHFADPGNTKTVEGSAFVPLSAISHRCGDRIEMHSDEEGRIQRLEHSGGYRLVVNWRDERVVVLGLVEGAEVPEVAEVPEIASVTGPVGTTRVLRRFGYTNAGLLGEVVNGSGLPMTFTYDGVGRMTRRTDRNGRQYSYTFDGRGRCVSAAGSDGFLASTCIYDEKARTTTVTDALGHATSYTHNELSQVVREVNPAGGVRLQDWDRYDRLLSETDPLGLTTRCGYDGAGNLIEVADPDGTRAAATYNSDQLPLSATDRTGATYFYTYDNRGNLAQTIDPLGAITRYSYDSAGHLKSVTDPLGAVTTLVCNGAGLPVRVTDPLGAKTFIERDTSGRVTRVVDPSGGVTLMTYTAEGWLASRTDGNGAVESWEHDAEGNTVAHTNAVGAVTRFEYTAFDEQTARIETDGTRLEFAYDLRLRLTSVTNPQGLTWVYEYDSSDNLIAETDFNGRTLRYTHDPAGQLATVTNGIGQTIRLSRDLAGRVVVRLAPDGRTGYEYDSAGRLVRAVSPTANLSVAYDPVGRIVAESVDGRTIRFAYDLAGRRVGRVTPTGLESSWTHDVRGDPTSVTTAGHTLRLSHDAAGNLVDQTLTSDAGWQVLRHSYDPVGRLLTATLFASNPGGAAGSRVVTHRGYGYRPDGYLTATVNEASDTRTLELDSLGRITAMTGSTWNERYAYDAAGNIISAEWPNGENAESESESESAIQGERDYEGTLIRHAGRYRFEHDAHGRVILRQRTRHSGKFDTWQYIWDSQDRLIGVQTPDGAQWSYTYDPLGRRVSKSHHGTDGTVIEWVEFAWDGARLVEQVHHRPGEGRKVTSWEYRPDTFTPIAQTDRQWLATAPQAEAGRYFHTIVTDLIGTPAYLITPGGEIAWHTQTTIWGTTIATSVSGVDCQIRLPGQYYDSETGHHYHNQRYYDPTIGRYLSQDSLGLVSTAPNPTAYVSNPTVRQRTISNGGCITRSHEKGIQTFRRLSPWQRFPLVLGQQPRQMLWHPAHCHGQD